MKPLAFRATYSDWKLIKTRGVVQIVMEVPLADYQTAYDVLGGMPDPARENWFAVAPLKNPQDEKETKQPETVSPKPSLAVGRPSEKAKREPRDWHETPTAQQAGILINDATFAAYLRERHFSEWRETGDADNCIKHMCGVTRKRDIAGNHKALVLWNQIVADYRIWGLAERVGA